MTGISIILILAALCMVGIYLIRRDIHRSQAMDGIVPAIAEKPTSIDVDDEKPVARCDGNPAYFASLATEPDTTKPAKLKPLPIRRPRKPVAKRAAPKPKPVAKPAAKAASKKKGPKK